MDLLASVRKEGSRGGRAEFKWDDVANSSHRENYLGHSLMAPVGRWQKNKDLSWYAKGDKSEAAAEARREEIRKVKEAEQDALSEALGFGPAPKRNTEGANANEVPLGKRDVERAVRETQEEGEGLGEAGRGLGFGAFEGPRGGDGKDVLQGAGDTAGTPEERALRRIIAEEKAKKGTRSRSRSLGQDRRGRRERSRERRRRRHEDDQGRARRRHHRHHRERDLESDQSRERSQSKERQGHRHRPRDDRYRERSYERQRSRNRYRQRSYSRDRNYGYRR